MSIIYKLLQIATKIYYKLRQLNYYKLQQDLLQITTVKLLQITTKFYYKLRQLIYYKLRQFYYKLRQLLQIATSLLQITTAITNCDNYHKLRQNSVICSVNVFDKGFFGSAGTKLVGSFLLATFIVVTIFGFQIWSS